MNIASIVLILTLFTGLAAAQAQPDLTRTGVGTVVPKEYTPAYICVVGYVEGIAHRHLLRNHFHRTLDQLGITHNSPLKDSLTQFTLKVIELNDKTYDTPLTDSNRQEWEEGKYEFLENRVRLTKKWYDEFLDAITDEGLDPDNVHKTMVEEGRKVIRLSLYGSASFSAKNRDIYRIFEPATKNPWLRKVED